MKLILLFLSVGVLQLAATELAAQQVTLTQQQGTLEAAFKAVKQQTGYDVLCKLEHLRNAKPVTVKLEGVPLQEAMKQILQGQDLEYTIEDKTIIISAKVVKEPAAEGRKDALASVPEPPPSQPPLRIRITDQEGNPLDGATIIHKPSKKSTMTDKAGRATVIAQLGDELDIRFIGYKRETVKVESLNQPLVLALETEESFLDEAVVTSYENTTRRNSIGNVASIDMKKVPYINNSNSLAALQGLAPGLDIQMRGGGLGQASKVRVQGDQSLLFAAPPIYVVDGVVISEYQSNSEARRQLPGTGLVIPNVGVETQNPRGNFLDLLDFNNIESITILKDAEAVAIYGSRAANGAVVIKTKRATDGSLSINSGFNLAWQPRRLDLMNTQEYLYMRRTAIKNSNVPEFMLNGQDFFDVMLYDSTAYIDWQDHLMGHSVFNYNLGVNLATVSNNSSNSLSFAYRPNKHFYDAGGKSEQYMLNNTWSGDFLNNKLNVVNISNFGYQVSSQQAMDLTSFAVTAAPNFPLELMDRKNIAWRYQGQELFNMDYDHPLRSLMNKYDNSDLRFMNSTSLAYQPSNELRMNLSYGLSTNISNDRSISKLNTEGQSLFPAFQNNLYLKDVNNWGHNLDGFLTKDFKQVFGIIDLTNIIGFNYNHANTTAGFFQFQGVVDEVYATNQQYYQTTVHKQHEEQVYRYAAFYNRFIARFKEFQLNVNYRYDGSSRFAPESRWASFYSFAGGWNVSESEWWKNDDIYLKIRSSYGRLGNDNIPDYQYLQRFGFRNSDNYPGGSVVSSLNMYARNYKWEDLRKFNIGYDFKFRGLSFIFDYAKSVSKDQLIGYRIPDYLGQAEIFQNFPGVFQVESFESTFDYRFNIGQARINTGLMITFPKNKLASFPGIEMSSYANTYQVGKSKDIARWPRFGGVDQETGLYYFLNNEGNRASTQTDWAMDFVETPIRYYGSLNLRAEYKKFSLSTNIYFRDWSSTATTSNYSISSSSPGVSSVAQMGNQYRFLLDNFDVNPTSPYQKFVAFGTLGAIGHRSELRNFFVRLNSINASYTFDQLLYQKKSSLGINLYMNNLLLYANRNVLNVEAAENTTMPQLLQTGLMLHYNF